MAIHQITKWVAFFCNSNRLPFYFENFWSPIKQLVPNFHHQMFGTIKTDIQRISSIIKGIENKSRLTDTNMSTKIKIYKHISKKQTEKKMNEYFFNHQ